MDTPATNDPQALSAKLLREQPARMAKWLALEVLLADEDVCADERVYDVLSALQEKWERETLVSHGLPPARSIPSP